MPHHRRHELSGRLQGETLVKRETAVEQESRKHLIRIAPQLNVVKIGGHGAIDYGRDVMFPLIEEIGTLATRRQILVVTGGGGRVRHIMDVGMDLGMPTGVLAELSAKISEQNAIMVAILLSPYNGVRIHTGDLLELPTLLKLGMLPVVHGTPPYGLYEHPPRYGLIPPHRTDTGAFLMAEVLGAHSCILGKNVDGLYTGDPARGNEADLIREITADELLAMDMEDMVLERMVVELLKDSVHLKEVRIVNCHTRGMIERAINGESVGTIIRAK
jgi:molybdenum storage protein